MARFTVDFLDDFSEAALVGELKRLAVSVGKETLSRRDIDQHGKMSSSVVLKRFGSLRKALQAANLRPARFMKASDDELLDLLEEAWVASLERFGRRPERADLRTLGIPVSPDTVVRRFGSWKKALMATAERAEREQTSGSDECFQAVHQSSAPARLARTTLPIRKRFFVLKRDLYRCRFCKAAGVPLEVDHIVPAARGGSDSLDNLQALCVPCNRGKRDSYE